MGLFTIASRIVENRMNIKSGSIITVTCKFNIYKERKGFNLVRTLIPEEVCFVLCVTPEATLILASGDLGWIDAGLVVRKACLITL